MEFIARKTRSAEQDFSVFKLREEGLGLEIDIPISTDTKTVILELRSEMQKLEKEIFGDVDLNDMKEDIKENIDINNLGKKGKKINVEETASKMLDEAFEKINFNKVKNSTVEIEQKKKDLEAKYFFELEGVDKDYILRKYCERFDLNETDANKIMGLEVLKENEVFIEKFDKNMNCFQYWIFSIIECIEGQFGYSFNKDEKKDF